MSFIVCPTGRDVTLKEEFFCFEWWKNFKKVFWRKQEAIKKMIAKEWCLSDSSFVIWKGNSKRSRAKTSSAQLAVNQNKLVWFEWEETWLPPLLWYYLLERLDDLHTIYEWQLHKYIPPAFAYITTVFDMTENHEILPGLSILSNYYLMSCPYVHFFSDKSLKKQVCFTKKRRYCIV